MTATPTLRELSPEDAPALARLWLACVEEVSRHEPTFAPSIAWQALAERTRRDLGTGRRFGWAAVDEGVLAGYALCRLGRHDGPFQQRDYLYLEDVDVAPAYRRQGLSRRLLERVEHFARARGIRRLELMALANDPRATAVWRGHGFRPHMIHMHKNLDE